MVSLAASMSGGIGGVLLCFLAGMAGGFVSSAPIGPINLWVMGNTLQGGARRLPVFLTGVIVADAAYAVAAAWGYTQFFRSGWLAGMTGFAAAAVFVILGLSSLRRLRQPAPASGDGRAEPKRGDLRAFLLGLFLCGANPAFLAFWLFAFSQLHDWFHILPAPVNLAVFVVGLVAGDSLWFGLLVWITRRGQNRMHPALLRGIRYGIAWALIIVGILAAVHEAWVMHPV